MTFDQFSSPHCHVQSLDTGSTAADFVAREVELGSKTITCTDHGTLGAALDVYQLGREAGLIPVIGVEAYLRDDQCPILLAAGAARTHTVPKGQPKEQWLAEHPDGSFYDHIKYMHVTLHARDYAAYRVLVRLLSKADARAEWHGGERKPIFGWPEIEELAAANTTCGSGCLVGLTQRHLLKNQDPATARAYFDRFHHLFGDRFHAEVFPHVCSHNWVKAVFVETQDDDGVRTTQRYWFDKKLRTSANEPDGFTAEDLAGAFSAGGAPRYLTEVKDRRTWVPLAKPLRIVTVQKKQEFVQNECSPWAPEGDVQWGCNAFVLDLARKRGVPIMISDDAHIATQEDQIVQTVRLSQPGKDGMRFFGSYHRYSTDEAAAYFRAKFGTSDAEIAAWVQNSRDWAEGFRGFEFDVTPELPLSFFPRDSLGYTKSLVKLHGQYRDEPQYRARLKTEIDLLHRNGVVDLLPYFWINEEVVRVCYTNQGRIVGPGRGSAAGCYFTSLFGMTHVDAVEQGLYLERFLTVDSARARKIPDIDQDLPDRWPLEGGEESCCVIRFRADDGTEHEVPDAWVFETAADRSKLLTIWAAHQTGTRLWAWWRADDPAGFAVVSCTTSAVPGGPESRWHGWLRERYGDYFAQISTNTKLKLSGAVLDVARARLGYVPEDVVDWSKRFEKPPMGVDDYDFVVGYSTPADGDVPGSITRDPALIAYANSYPDDYKVMLRCLGLPRQKGRHASAFVMCDQPVGEKFPVTTIKGHRCTEFDMTAIERLGGLKMDFLVVEALNDVEECLRLIRERHPVPADDVAAFPGPKQYLVPLPGGGTAHLYHLPDDPAVYADITAGRTETVFQLNTGGARKWLRYFDRPRAGDDARLLIACIRDIATFTALDRPGPLNHEVENPDAPGAKHNMVVEYTRRMAGDAPSPGVPAIMDQLAPETAGVMVFQETLQRIYQQVTGKTLTEAEKFRRLVSKKKASDISKAYEGFMAGTAAHGLLSVEDAQKAWDTIQTFSAYGFNKSVDGGTTLDLCDGKKQIRDVIPGDTLYGVDKQGKVIKTKVVALHDHGELPGFEVTFEGGYSIVVSGNHKFLTPKGQIPLHQIVAQDTEVLRVSEWDWAARENGRAHNSVWGELSDTAAGYGPSQDLRFVPTLEAGKYSCTDVQAQPSSRAARRRFKGCEENVRTSRNQKNARRVQASVAESESRETPGLGDGLSEDRQGKRLKGRKLVEEQRNVDLAARASQVRRRDESETRGLHFPPRVGRSGRVLPFFRTKKREIDNEATISKSRTSPGCDAKQGSIGTGCDIDPISRRMLQILGWFDEARVAHLVQKRSDVANTGSLVRGRIVRVRSVGSRRMYDLEVSHEQHNFVLPDGIVTSNSHAYCYAVTAYATAWLKHHYPLEWWCSVLTHATKQKVDAKHWAHVQDFALLPDIGRSKKDWAIEGDKLRAPLSLLAGLGESAHAQILAYPRYESVEDLVQMVHGAKLAGAYQRPKVNKKTGAEEMVDALGRSAVNRSHVWAMIVVGACDSLFPAGWSAAEKMAAYDRRMLAVAGKSYKASIKPHPTLDTLGLYQVAKDVLRPYGRDLRPVVAHPDLRRDRSGAYLAWDFRWPSGDTEIREARLLSVQELSDVEEMTTLPQYGVTAGAAAYIDGAVVMQYGPGKRRRAVRLQLEVGAAKFEAVRWPDYGSDMVSQEWMDRYRPGSVVLAVLERRRPDKGFSVKEIKLVRGPLEKESNAKKRSKAAQPAEATVAG